MIQPVRLMLQPSVFETRAAWRGRRLDLPMDLSPLQVDVGAPSTVESPEHRSVVLRLSGEVDLAAAEVLRTPLVRVEPWPIHELIIDARDVSFADCGGLRALQRLCDAYGVSGRVRCPSPAMRCIIELVTPELLGWRRECDGGDLLIEPRSGRPGG